MIPEFSTRRLPEAYDVLAPDGSEVRVLLGLAGGGMAHFRLPAGQISLAVAHRTVEEIWYIVSGTGQMWRKCGDREEIVPLEPGVSLTIPLGTQFQFCAGDSAPLEAVAATMPPWPGPEEAFVVEGIWKPTISALPP